MKNSVCASLCKQNRSNVPISLISPPPRLQRDFDKKAKTRIGRNNSKLRYRSDVAALKMGRIAIVIFGIR
jgi:hypothetical protein